MALESSMVEGSLKLGKLGCCNGVLGSGTRYGELEKGGTASD
jgi:hypothetical protein